METILIISSLALWFVVLFNLALTLGLVRRINLSPRAVSSSPRESLKAGQQAPDFTAQTLSEETVTLATYAGRKIVFLFISTQCRPCLELLSTIKDLLPAATRAGVDIILVSTDEAEATRTFAAEHHIQAPILVAPRNRNSFIQDYKVSGTPSYCFINERGIVESAGHPGMQWEEWRTLVASWTKNEEKLVPSK